MFSSSEIKEIVSHPNTLTLYRIIAIPIIIVLLFFPESRICTFFAALIFTAAAITDFFDGYIARNKGLVSSLGKTMDPLADKLLVSSVFIMMTHHGWVEAWIVCVIIGREFAVTGLRSIIVEKGEDVSASWLGKYKVGFQIAAIIPLLLHFDYFTFEMHKIGSFLLWIALIMTVWSGADYFIRFRKLMQD
ncbi:MAG: CDP-diacylglycerol--glycerol-3-phosphate 3-phosphatidyltransferase [Desulfobacterales bacterium]|jgi:CDP-diacylglycerol---glycerol-3-phosphate 3-phosphatidyltransferase|nr:CDP-diacylglycerol--glycerol-3-phosphate 3-phosphatidyltransferase [Desulfobacteraceae bacterium]MBT4365338.1 CDP-diacylglycerol--glycerol-3-phosphate 3-phosphatidyltransferase [Desulfobacteraceae bacterium]MBT7085126.1 CDP-diacylglycerol--glycerol-3-phosphate 3-phosphatidyltransferase [Desulfobacterales bacterium]MBT7697593.1 CDP-diacylglycerol--glycerol-3-phosphate 3-phosphatidyltransferase [Desulfobacterales bacterium]